MHRTSQPGGTRGATAPGDSTGTGREGRCEISLCRVRKIPFYLRGWEKQHGGVWGLLDANTVGWGCQPHPCPRVPTPHSLFCANLRWHFQHLPSRISGSFPARPLPAMGWAGMGPGRRDGRAPAPPALPSAQVPAPPCSHKRKGHTGQAIQFPPAREFW